MDALIYTAMSGAERALRGQQVHANNLANAETAGFRANMELSAAQSLQKGYGYDDRHMSQLQANAVSTRQGALKSTGRDLDVAVSGDGFFTVQGPTGEAYTRAGALTIDATGQLMSGHFPVLGEGGPITVPQYTRLAIGQDGTVSIQQPGTALMQTIDKLKLVKAEASELTKNEAGLLVARNGQPLPTDATVLIRSGHLEGSNVSAVEEMIATMSLNRTFEIQMKMLKASDTMDEAANRLVSG